MNRERGNALVSVLAAAAIIMVLVAISMYGGLSPKKSTRADGLGKTVQGNAMAEAKDIKCQNNLSQIRQSIQMSMTTEDTPPAKLEDVRFPASMYKCPIGGEAYEYDPSTGTVKCPHPGHEKL
jgi:hypothetical protein